MNDDTAQTTPAAGGEDGPTGPVAEPGQEQKGKLPIGCLAWLGVIAFGIVSCSVYAFAGGGDEPDDPSAYVKVACRDWVKQQLKAPSTAEFSSEVVNSTGLNEYTVTGHVDAQNSFGAMIGNTYRCVASHAGGTTTRISVTVG